MTCTLLYSIGPVATKNKSIPDSQTVMSIATLDIYKKIDLTDSSIARLPKFSMDDYRMMKRLGEGGFGQVVLAQTRTAKQVSTGFSSQNV
jgi:hypothetical protein